MLSYVPTIVYSCHLSRSAQHVGSKTFQLVQLVAHNEEARTLSVKLRRGWIQRSRRVGIAGRCRAIPGMKHNRQNI